MQFTRLTKDNVNLIKEYFERSEISFCDISLGAKYMWRDEYVIDFCVFEDTLIMKEKGPDYQGVFYYPMGANVSGALLEIEKYCKENALTLEFCCIDDAKVQEFKARYNQIHVYDDQDWNDYIYTAEQFKTYAGKKLSGQRNHVNKFKKSYPEYKFKLMTENDAPRVNEFLDEFSLNPFMTDALKEEVEMTRDYLAQIDALGQLGGYLEIDGKIVAISIGEIVGDTLIVHVEKGLTVFSGVYPTMAQEFAKAFASDKVKYINREEDCGDLGLRRSKTQYHPIEIKRKNAVIVKTLFDGIENSLCFNTERLTVNDIKERDKTAYYKLYTDELLNEFWGYDYKQDLGDKTPSPEYFYDFQKSLKDNKEEYSVAVRERQDGDMIGELVLHNFDYYGGVEIGFRFFKEYQGKGYAYESVKGLIEYAFGKLNATKIKAKCFKKNSPSKKLLTRLGFSETVTDAKMIYFELYR